MSCVLDACQIEGKQATIKEVMFMHACFTISMMPVHLDVNSPCGLMDLMFDLNRSM